MLYGHSAKQEKGYKLNRSPLRHTGVNPGSTLVSTMTAPLKWCLDYHLKADVVAPRHLLSQSKIFQAMLREVHCRRLVNSLVNVSSLLLLFSRGQWNPPIPGPLAASTTSTTNSAGGSTSQNLLQRAYDLQRKDSKTNGTTPGQPQQQHRSPGQRALSSDDSVVFTGSRSNHQLGMRNGKRRGESFK